MLFTSMDVFFFFIHSVELSCGLRYGCYLRRRGVHRRQDLEWGDLTTAPPQVTITGSPSKRPCLPDTTKWTPDVRQRHVCLCVCMCDGCLLPMDVLFVFTLCIFNYHTCWKGVCDITELILLIWTLNYLLLCDMIVNGSCWR